MSIIWYYLDIQSTLLKQICMVPNPQYSAACERDMVGNQTFSSLFQFII